MKARIPLTRRTVDGISCPFPLVTLQVQDKYGTYAKLLFRIDTGADFCGIPIALARREQIAFSERKPGVATGLVGSTKKFHDLIRVLIAGNMTGLATSLKNHLYL